MTATPLEVRRVRIRAAVTSTTTSVLLCVFGVLLLTASVAALATREIDLRGVVTVLFLGGLGAWQIVASVRRLRDLRPLVAPMAVLRLDDAGVHAWQGVDRGPQAGFWLSVPWDDVAWVASSRPDAELLPEFDEGPDRGPLRFVLHDDGRLPLPPDLDRAELRDPYVLVLACRLGLTPAQARLTQLLAPADHARVVTWLRAECPDLPVVENDAVPWVTPLTPDPWPDEPRIAVLGAAGRLGRLLVERLVVPDAPPPVVLVRNEVHRAHLERAGAEVRMIDVGIAGRDWWLTALRGCQSMVVTSHVLVTEALLDACHDGR